MSSVPNVWRSDIQNAPHTEDAKFLLMKPDGLVTTAYFYWYTEGDHESFKPVAYWALHDAITDMPLDEDGPVEELGYKWMPIPSV